MDKPVKYRGVDPRTLPPKHDHPATYSKELFEPLVSEMVGARHVLDPFAGVGTIHALAEAAGVPYSTGIELEREWANEDLYSGPERIQFIGDSRLLISLMQPFDCVVTSPAYANRMADHHDAQENCKACGGKGYFGPYPVKFGVGWEKDRCKKCDGVGRREYKRNTYKHRLGRDLTPGNSGAMQWTGKGGEEYRELHREVWALCVEHLEPGGKFVLNCKDHYRMNERQFVTDFHSEVLQQLGLWFQHYYHVTCMGNRHGANREKRAEYESVLVFTKGEL